MIVRTVVAMALAMATAQTAPVSSVVKYSADKNHSTVGFNVPIMGFGKVTGKFTEFEIAIVHDEKDITKSFVKVTIQSASVNTGVADRDTHLRSEDFFDVEKFPQITFESSSIAAGQDGEFVAHGIFTLRGVQKRIDLPFRMMVQNDPKTGRSSLGVLARTTLNRRDFGITWKHHDVPDFVGDEIAIDLAITTRLGRREPTP